ncbi:MAG: rhodanese-like domain-containing protein [Gammaproteobacteria bacterium]|nr:MAG: rhodanese-like domain-containing protein [Gammaproteobacteria bacterium]
MKKFTDFINECRQGVDELFPWDLQEMLNSDNPPMLLDVREPYEFDAMHIEGSLNVPRGILEAACEYDYEETIAELVEARNRKIIILCRSGNRSILAACIMKQMGYTDAISLKTGLRGWNDFEAPLVNKDGDNVVIDDADTYFTPSLRPEQLADK